MPEAGQSTKMTQSCFVVFGGLCGVLFPVGCGGTRVPEAGQSTKMTVVPRCVWSRRGATKMKQLIMKHFVLAREGPPKK